MKEHSFGLYLLPLLFLSTVAVGYPIDDAAVGLPNPELVAVYPDDRDKNLYYFLPTSVELVRRDNDIPGFGVQHFGFSRADPAGLGASLTMSVRPSFNEAKLKQVADELKKRNPDAKWAAMPLLCSRMELLVNGHFLPDEQVIANKPPVAQVSNVAVVTPQPKPSSDAIAPADAVVSADDPAVPDKPLVPAIQSLCVGYNSPRSPVSSMGGSVDATQAFSVEVKDVGARALSQGVAPDSDVLGARFTYVFRAVGKRLHARVTVNARRVYEHFKNGGKARGWWGMGRSSWSAEWQKLRNSGAIKLEVLEGGAPDAGEDYMMTVFKALTDARIKEEGMFKPALKPAGIAGAPESSKWGWGFSGSHGWEKTDEKTTFEFEIDRRQLEEREYSVALSFNAVCARYPNNFVDLSTNGRKCIDMNLFQKVVRNTENCREGLLNRLKKQLDQGLISQKTWERRSDEVDRKPCL